MFVEAIESVDKFTRPIYSLTRTYGGTISGGTGTMFFVNNDGVAVTCKHIAQLIIQANQVNETYAKFSRERSEIKQGGNYWEALAELEAKYNYTSNTVIQIKLNYFKAFDSITTMQLHLHGTLDLAIIEFQGFKEKRYGSHARFVDNKDLVKQGQYLCRLGYPFPEFTNYQLNKQTDDIEWTETGNPNTPRFPIDGIITRFVSDGKQVASIEMSTPGLRGQSGGPLFDTNGQIYGMQFLTSHYHLGFDMQEKEVMINGVPTNISNYPFLHVGWCVHVDRIREFLDEKKIKYFNA